MAVRKGGDSGGASTSTAGERSGKSNDNVMSAGDGQQSVTRSMLSAASRQTPLHSKIKGWLSEADYDQCFWAIDYLLSGSLAGPPSYQRIGNWPIETLRDFVLWIFVGSGKEYCGVFVVGVSDVRLDSHRYFGKTRNAWNQRVNRRKKKELKENTVKLSKYARQKLEKIAGAHGLSESECLEILIDLVSERRESLPDLKARRREAKRVALSADMGV